MGTQQNIVSLFTPGGYRAVYIPDSVTTIGDGAFQNCRMMEEIYFGDGLTELPADVCAGAGSYPYKENTTSKVSEKRLPCDTDTGSIRRERRTRKDNI